ncbi:MAG: hypothetical protein COT92_00575 [Candidatus Doudnabacteria bacterium CG10_big_fil_rev_8_21_14_0_10_42_18]|uniref:Uncharacterized protein n=1 Tax=Candidatus Doudnabacteria bacterium CG10_big_fil_rev_8_21_14_0_10_42_18 TaxID=1974552 RepID=A0A2H0VBQ4_9BACT|nr:MAG: hypothetical protein COT92_00575 [Candidatus Doudnabacteria bacterium CG10_big_fil_rev_8_21_14_0_10_42_18]
MTQYRLISFDVIGYMVAVTYDGTSFWAGTVPRTSEAITISEFRRRFGFFPMPPVPVEEQ